MIRNILNSFVTFAFSTGRIQAPKRYSQLISRARCVMPMYQMNPYFQGDIFIAPNATIIGDVVMGNKISIWHGTVLRGDINSITLTSNIMIGDNCVLHTAASVPSGIQANIQIQGNNVIQSGCTLYSCHIRQKAFIGSNSVILQGAVIQEGAIIAPNSVVPPGRVVPAMQVWGGNPIKYIRNTLKQQAYITYEYSEVAYQLTNDYRYMFLPYNNAYLYKQNTPEDQVTKWSTISQYDILRANNKYSPRLSTIQ